MSMSATARNDSIQERISPDCPSTIQQILYHAWSRDVSGLKPLLDVPGRASCQDPQTRETPLHAAIRSCGPAEKDDSEDHDGEDGVEEEAKETIRELFLAGAIWNDVDSNDETPGCVAWRLCRKGLYNLCVDAGVRAELLFGLFGGYEELSSGPEDDEDKDEEDAREQNGADNGVEVEAQTASQPEASRRAAPASTELERNAKNEEYLQSNLTYAEGKLVDEHGNGVMMAWETDIMRRSVDALLPDREGGKRILNVGFGMGIIDTMFSETKPERHHIIEAHPTVLEHLSKPDSKFGSSWESSGSTDGAYKVHKGKWQDIVPKLLEQGEIYDAIYFDTFGEDYSQLRLFFTEYIPALLDEQGRFGFFNGLGADRRICYDVYSKVVEMHLTDAGLDVDWEEIDVDMESLEEAGKGGWEGVKRRYWTLDRYRLPVCTFMG